MLDGSVGTREHVVVEVPATDLTWWANCERIANEVEKEVYLKGGANTVNAVCRRLLELDVKR
jgi:hypothetical protein